MAKGGFGGSPSVAMVAQQTELRVCSISPVSRQEPRHFGPEFLAYETDSQFPGRDGLGLPTRDALACVAVPKAGTGAWKNPARA